MFSPDMARKPVSSVAIGAQLRAARHARGFSLTQVCVKSRISRSALSRMERGEIGVALDRLISVSEALGVTVEIVTKRSRSKVAA
jgi:transcriptional regulator with XRE-family HTH domain